MLIRAFLGHCRTTMWSSKPAPLREELLPVSGVHEIKFQKEHLECYNIEKLIQHQARILINTSKAMKIKQTHTHKKKHTHKVCFSNHFKKSTISRIVKPTETSQTSSSVAVVISREPTARTSKAWGVTSCESRGFPLDPKNCKVAKWLIPWFSLEVASGFPFLNIS